MSYMTMILLLPFALFVSINFNFNALEPLKPLSLSLHNICLSWFTPKLPKDRPSHDLSRSFICGQKVTQPQQKITLQKSGLYHAIVVSGGHFLFIESALKWLAWPSWLRFILLAIYFLVTGLQAPGLRCLTQMSAVALTHTNSKKTGSLALCFYSGLFCLVIASPLWTSLSFWLSFSVALALGFTQELTTQKTRTLKFILPLILIYLFLLPFNFSKGYPHPLNLILGMLLLYPFCLILFISACFTFTARVFDVAALYSVTDDINKNLFLTLQKWTMIIPDKNYHTLSIFYFWVYLFILFSCFYVFILFFRRDTIHE